MKCVVCNQRKGKRYCPAKTSMICAQCCGEKRILEINCPESCEYLKIGRSHEAEVERSRLRPSDPVTQQLYARVVSQFQGVIAHLEYVLGRERQTSRDLTDQIVAEALDLLLKTYRTEEKGIIYESVTNDLRVDIVRRHLKEVMDSYRKPSDSRQETLQLQDVLDCLGLVRDLVASHLETGTASYVDFLARAIPRGSELESPGPSLIIPG
jgi:hypothetical protein